MDVTHKWIPSSVTKILFQGGKSDLVDDHIKVFDMLELKDNSLKVSLKSLIHLLSRTKRVLLTTNTIPPNNYLLTESLTLEIQRGIATLDILRDEYVWEHLNVGHWKLVPTMWRKSYTFITLLKVIFSFILQEMSLKDVIHQCDMGLLMGQPVFENILSQVTEEISEHLKQSNKGMNFCEEILQHKTSVPSSLLLNVDTFSLKPQCLESRFEITYSDNPSLEAFLNVMTRKTPLIINKAIEHWPARKKWSVQYIEEVAGFRTVPVEIGPKYTSENWTQKLMTISDFIAKFMNHGFPLPLEKRDIGYIAQHHLFDQILTLRDDIRIPDYCSLGENKNVEINAWFGPGGTVSPTHFDLKHNLLTQVFGTKIIRLYPPSEQKYLQPFSCTSILFNTSQIDIEDENVFDIHPDMKKAKYCEFLLEPGMTLYIPPKWWHFVKSLTPCFSVSFWFE